jgi:hypothetical protein
MSAPIADGVMAATHKLVQQAMTGQWQEVPKTIQEQEWLSALRQAMTESDAAVAQIAQSANVSVGSAPGAVGPALAGQSVATEPTDAISTVMDMLGKGP